MAGVLAAFVGGSFGLPPATYAVAANGGATSVNEGSSLQFNVTGTNIVNGTYYWTVTNSGDFSTASGSFTITSNAGNFSVTPTADLTTEGSETFQAQVRTVSTSGTIVATSASITINDTSTAPLVTWRLFEKMSDSSQFGTVYNGGVDSNDRIFVIRRDGYLTTFSSGGVRLEHQRYPTGPINAKSTSTQNMRVNGTNVGFNTTGTSPQANQFLVHNSTTIATIDLQLQFESAASDVAGQFAKDSAGNYYISHSSTTSTGRTSVTKVNSSGVVQFTRSIVGSNTGSLLTSHTGALCLDSSNNFYFGWAQNNTYLQCITKYNSSGTVQWRRNFNPSGTAFRAQLLHYGGFIYYCYEQGSILKVVKMDTNGTHQWTRQATIANNMIENGLFIGPNGILWTADNNSQGLWGILNLDGTTGSSWSVVNNSGTAGSVVCHGAAWDSAGRIVLTGAVLRSPSDYYTMIIKHTTSQGGVNMGSISGGSSGTYSLNTAGISWSNPGTTTFATTLASGANEDTTSGLTRTVPTHTMTAGSAASDTVLVGL